MRNVVEAKCQPLGSCIVIANDELVSSSRDTPTFPIAAGVPGPTLFADLPISANCDDQGLFPCQSWLLHCRSLVSPGKVPDGLPARANYSHSRAPFLRRLYVFRRLPTSPFSCRLIPFLTLLLHRQSFTRELTRSFLACSSRSYLYPTLLFDIASSLNRPIFRACAGPEPKASLVTSRQ